MSRQSDSPHLQLIEAVSAAGSRRVDVTFLPGWDADVERFHTSVTLGGFLRSNHISDWLTVELIKERVLQQNFPLTGVHLRALLMNSFLPESITSTQVVLQLHATLHSAPAGHH